jgi:hypothetical protein
MPHRTEAWSAPGLSGPCGRMGTSDGLLNRDQRSNSASKIRPTAGPTQAVVLATRCGAAAPVQGCRDAVVAQSGAELLLWTWTARQHTCSAARIDVPSWTLVSAQLVEVCLSVYLSGPWCRRSSLRSVCLSVWTLVSGSSTSSVSLSSPAPPGTGCYFVWSTGTPQTGDTRSLSQISAITRRLHRVQMIASLEEFAVHLTPSAPLPL